MLRKVTQKGTLYKVIISNFIDFFETLHRSILHGDISQEKLKYVVTSELSTLEFYSAGLYTKYFYMFLFRLLESSTLF